MLARARTMQLNGNRATTTAFAVLLALALLLSWPAAARDAPETFADLAEELLPSVVNISTTQVVQRRERPDIPQAPPGSPFEDFFREFFERNQPENSPRRRATSLGFRLHC